MCCLRNSREFKGSDDPEWISGSLHSKSAPVIKGVEEADRALKLSQEERLALIVELLPSSDEDEEMDSEYKTLVDERKKKRYLSKNM